MTLRSRLTLLIGGTLVLALLGFSAALYLALARTTLAMAQDALATEAARLAGEKGFTLTKIIEPPQSIGLPVTYVQTLDAGGEPLAHSTNLASFAIPLSAAGLATVQAGTPWSEIVPKADKRLLVYSLPVRDGEAVVGVLQVARSLADRDDALASLRTLLIGGALLTLLAAGGLGWLLASAALRPIGRMTRTAEAIGRARDFAQRLPAPTARDEVGALSATLNTMLAELEGAHGQVAHSLEAQRRFIADASHELRTPLTTMRGFLALLERDPPISRDDARTALGATIAEADRLIRLVNQLFLLARTDAGQLQYALAPVALAPLIEGVVAQAHVRAPERVIVTQVAPEVTALGDADAIAQVLLNLIENALVHTPPESRITLTARADDGRATISVADSGPGIPADQLPHLFERFYQADPSRVGAGAGLGLAIARAVAEAQGGALSVESVPGTGSRFTLGLPLARPTAPAHA